MSIQALAAAVFVVTAGPIEPAATSEAPPGRPAYLEIAEILRRMRASDTAYKIVRASRRKDIDLQRSVEAFWPQRLPRYPSPWVVANPRGENAVVSFPFERKANALFDEAEPLFRANRCPEALRLYEEATRVSPEHYWAYLRMGHCYSSAGQYAKALDRYDRASAINPDDYLTFLTRGNALAGLGKYPEARESYIWSLVLNPRSPDVLGAIRPQAGRLGVRLREDTFVPLVLARREADAIAIYFGSRSGTGAAWLAYGSCKAFWMGDGAHRKEMTGSADHRWTSLEEKECLAALLAVYNDGRAKGTIQPDRAFDRIRRVLEDGFIEEFVLYEMGSRVDPHITLKLEPAAKDRMREYVSHYVVTPR